MPDSRYKWGIWLFAVWYRKIAHVNKYQALFKNKQRNSNLTMEMTFTVRKVDVLHHNWGPMGEAPVTT